MKAASLSELKKELNTMPAKEILELCMRITKYKKENKELLTYLLFEAHDEAEYIRNIKIEIEQQFLEINQNNIYFAKKSIRKILRMTNKFIKYSGQKRTEAELLIYYLTILRNSGIPIYTSTALSNLYERQIQKIQKAISALHEDLQFDFSEILEPLLDFDKTPVKKKQIF